MPILEIANRTITVVPGITGLIDRLEKAGFRRPRAVCEGSKGDLRGPDRKGAEDALAALDEPLGNLHEKLIGHLTKTELKELIRLLEKARGPLSAEE